MRSRPNSLSASFQWFLGPLFATALAACGSGGGPGGDGGSDVAPEAAVDGGFDAAPEVAVDGGFDAVPEAAVDGLSSTPDADAGPPADGTVRSCSDPSQFPTMGRTCVRWVGQVSHLPCPPAGDGWMVSSEFAPNPPPGLARFCLYTWMRSGETPDLCALPPDGALAPWSWLAPDCAGVGP